MRKFGNALQWVFGQLVMSPTTGVGAPLVVGNVAFTGGVSSQIINTSAVSGDIARLTVAADAVQIGLYAAPGAQSVPIVTNGPTGGQTVLRTLGAQPIVFGTSNTYVGQFLATGGFVVATPTNNTTAIVANARAGNRALQCIMGDSSSVGLEIVDPGPNNTVLRANTNNSQCIIQALGTSTSLALWNSSGIVLTMNSAGDSQFAGGLSMNNKAPYGGLSGWGTPTGAAAVPNFSGSAATLVQTSTAVAGLISALKNFGLALA